MNHRFDFREQFYLLVHLDNYREKENESRIGKTEKSQGFRVRYVLVFLKCAGKPRN